MNPLPTSFKNIIFFSERGRDENYIKVKLPDDILKHFEKQYGINSDDHISNILG